MFLPIKKFNEIDTWAFVEYLKSQNANIIVSKSDTSSNSMIHYLLDEDSEIKTNKWGIPEPISGKKINELHIDKVLIPLLTFDKLGNRLGYGKGYYDVFLKKCRPNCKKIGLALNAPVDLLPSEPFDVKLDYCISPQGLHTFEPEEQ